MSMTEDTLRARFHELGKLIEQVHAASQPLRDEYDQLSQSSKKRLAELAEQFNAIERDANLFDMKNERAMLSRALKGKTGERPA